MKINLTEEEIWQAWNEIVEHPEQAGCGSFIIIRKVIEESIELNKAHG